MTENEIKLLKGVESLLSKIKTNIEADPSTGVGSSMVSTWVESSHLGKGKNNLLQQVIDLLQKLRIENINANAEGKDTSQEGKSEDKSDTVSIDIEQRVSALEKRERLNEIKISKIQERLKYILEADDNNSNNEKQNQKKNELVNSIPNKKASLQEKSQITETNKSSEDKSVRENIELNEKRPQVILSDKAQQDMDDFISTYNNDPKMHSEMKLTLVNKEINYRRYNTPQNIQEVTERPGKLIVTSGTPKYSGKEISGMPKSIFVVPARETLFNKVTVWTNAYAYFFDIENIESLQAKSRENSKFLLIQPAIVEMQEDRNYHLTQRGQLKVIS